MTRKAFHNFNLGIVAASVATLTLLTLLIVAALKSG